MNQFHPRNRLTLGDRWPVDPHERATAAHVACEFVAIMRASRFDTPELRSLGAVAEVEYQRARKEAEN